MKLNYIQIIGKLYPNVGCSCRGNGSVYENITWESGDPIPDKDTLDNLIHTDTQNTMWELIKAERDRRKSVGGYKVGNYWYHSDDTSRIQQIALVMLGANMPGGVMWKTMSGDFVSMTPTLAMQIFQSAIASDMAIFTIAEQKRAAMMASPDPASYDPLSGWPLIYGE
jgi:hypothetical protein